MWPNATHIAASLITELFSISLLQLSAWMCSVADCRFTVRLTAVKPLARISQVLEEFVDVTWCDKQVVTWCAWMIREVEDNRGRLKLANSFESIFRLRGHECFAASNESRMQQIVVTCW